MANTPDDLPVPNVRNVLSYFSVFNVQGLVPQTKPSKVPYISDLLHSNNQLFINLTETWVGNHKEAELQIDGYVLFNSERNHKGRSNKGCLSGGVATYVRTDYSTSFKPLLKYSNGVVEALCLYSSLHNLVIINIYRQPDNPLHRSTNKHFGEVLLMISNILESLSAPTPTIIMTGDFNLPHADWKNLKCKSGASRDEQQMFALLLCLTDEFFMTQVVDKPTHYEGNTLDLIFTNNSDVIFDCQHIEPLRTTSHHHVLEITTSIKMADFKVQNQRKSHSNIVSSPLSSLNFSSPDIAWSSLDNDLSLIDWVTEFKNHNVDEILDKFLSISFDIAKKYVPLRKKGGCHKIPIPKDRRKLMTRRRCINKQLVRTKSSSSKAKFKSELVEIEKKLQASYRHSKDCEEHNAIKSIKKNSKFFYSYAKRFSKLKSKVGLLLDGKNIVQDDAEMANLLASEFCDAYSTPKCELPPSSKIFDDDFYPLSTIPFHEEDLIEAISDIKSNSSNDILGFSSSYLRNCKHSLVKPLYILWSKSLNEGVIPKSLKRTIITPIYKKGNRGNPVNYRPVASSSHLIKIFEKVIRKYTIAYLEEN